MFVIVDHMGKAKIRFIVAAIALFGFSLVFFGVLYAEEGKRIMKVELDRQAFLRDQQAISEERKKYFDEIAGKKAELRAGMSAAKDRYESLLQTQKDIIAQNQTTKTETVTIPVQTKVVTQSPVAVSKPKTTRSTKTS